MISSELAFRLGQYLLREAEGMNFANEVLMRTQCSLSLTNYLKTEIPENIVRKETTLGDQIKSV